MEAQPHPFSSRAKPRDLRFSGPLLELLHPPFITFPLSAGYNRQAFVISAHVQP
jgi:hypothetical protein